jgi:hypothetical protein
MTILEDIKTGIGIAVDNLGFDHELLVFINSAKGNLVQLGVTEFDIPLDETTEWPSFGSEAMTSHVKSYILVKVKQTFDPTASESINRVLESALQEVEGRITYEVQEVANP